MAAFLDRESQEPGSGSVDSGAAGMCGAIGNLLGTASDTAAVNQPNSTNQTSARNDEQQGNNDEKQAKVSVMSHIANFIQYQF